MRMEEIEKIVVTYFGFTPAQRLPKDIKIEIVDVEDVLEAEELNKLQIKWDNHIGGETKVARLTPLDILHYLNLENNTSNYKKAVDILKYLAKKNKGVVVKVGERYLLINPRYRR